MATSSFFRPFVVRQEDEAAWVRAFTKKVKRNKRITYTIADKDRAAQLLEKLARNK